jgi:hypothetical protein
MYHQGGSRAEKWRLKIVPPVAFNQERLNLTEGGLDVQGGYLPPCSQGLLRQSHSDGFGQLFLFASDQFLNSAHLLLSWES